MTAEELPAVTLAKMDGKLDVISERLAAIARDGEDHEARLRLIEARPVITVDRIEALEQRPCVTWRQLWAVIAAMAAAVSAATPFIAQLYGGS